MSDPQDIELDPEAAAIVDGFIVHQLDRVIARVEQAQEEGDYEEIARMREAVQRAFESTIGKDLNNGKTPL